MKTTLTYLLIILATFVLAFAFTALLSIPWIAAHWLRQSLVILMVLITVGIGTLIFMEKAKGQSKK